MATERPLHQPHRDADEEALQAALLESMQPDYMAEILEAEAHQHARATVETEATRATVRAAKSIAIDTEVDDKQDGETNNNSSSGVNSEMDDLREQIELALQAQSNGDTDIQDDSEEANQYHPLLNLAEFLLLDILSFVDEDTIGFCFCVCKRLLHVARSELLFEKICRQIFPVQCPKVAVAAAADRFALRKFRSWFQMFHDRPRVRYNGFYYLRVSYYKKPELNMWTEIVPGTILQVIYYRYFAFQRDGSVLYAMLFKPPHEATPILKHEKAHVYRGRYHVERNELFVSVPTDHSVIEFRFHITQRQRGKNVRLMLKEHYAFSEPDRSGWVDYFDTNDEEFQYYRSWNL